MGITTNMNFYWLYFYTQIQTTIHKFWVLWYASKIACGLIWRALTHDLSKYQWCEAKHFARETTKLKNLTLRQ